MSAGASELENLVNQAMTALADGPGEPAHAQTTMRERFFEIMVLILGNLYTKTPVASPLFDRTTMLRITTGMDDGDAGRLAGRTEDWLRLEGMLRQQDGAKAYFCTTATLAILSTLSSKGTLGEVLAQILKRYQEQMPSETLRKSARDLGSYFLSRSV
jgi:hypothetical protein